jgi:hypothetical protein
MSRIFDVLALHGLFVRQLHAFIAYLPSVDRFEDGLPGLGVL